jgi:hypothetical protein
MSNFVPFLLVGEVVANLVVVALLGAGLFWGAIAFLKPALNRMPDWKPHAATESSGSVVNQPAGRYLRWPLPLLVATLILGLIPAVAFCQGDPVVFGASAILNPVLWFAIYPFLHLGGMACPHCRKSGSMASVSDAPVGSSLMCPRCNNVVSKPAG